MGILGSLCFLVFFVVNFIFFLLKVFIVWASFLQPLPGRLGGLICGTQKSIQKELSGRQWYKYAFVKQSHKGWVFYLKMKYIFSTVFWVRVLRYLFCTTFAHLM